MDPSSSPYPAFEIVLDSSTEDDSSQSSIADYQSPKPKLDTPNSPPQAEDNNNGGSNGTIYIQESTSSEETRKLRPRKSTILGKRSSPAEVASNPSQCHKQQQQTTIPAGLGGLGLHPSKKKIKVSADNSIENNAVLRPSRSPSTTTPTTTIPHRQNQLLASFTAAPRVVQRRQRTLIDKKIVLAPPKETDRGNLPEWVTSSYTAIDAATDLISTAWHCFPHHIRTTIMERKNQKERKNNSIQGWKAWKAASMHGEFSACTTAVDVLALDTGAAYNNSNGSSSIPVKNENRRTRSSRKSNQTPLLRHRGGFNINEFVLRLLFKIKMNGDVEDLLPTDDDGDLNDMPLQFDAHQLCYNDKALKTPLDGIVEVFEERAEDEKQKKKDECENRNDKGNGTMKKDVMVKKGGIKNRQEIAKRKRNVDIDAIPDKKKK